MDGELQKHTCCFTGHRPEKLSKSEYETKCRLEDAIRNTVREGYSVFISGMSRGVDMWAAEIVLRLKYEGYPIKLICAIPFPGFEKKWDDDLKKEYTIIIDSADNCEYICSHFSRNSFQLRNKWMVDRSSKIIAVFNGSAGGTKNTLKYAASKNITVYLIE